MQRLVVKELLSPKEKELRAKQYQEWLHENGFSTSLEARNDIQSLEQIQSLVTQLQATSEQLNAQIQTLINDARNH